jgi:hypothetical protein
MNDAEQLYVHMRLLMILDAFRGATAREDQLFAQYEISAPGVRRSGDELKADLEELRSLGFVRYEIPTLGPKRWAITPEGKKFFQGNKYSEW